MCACAHVCVCDLIIILKISNIRIFTKCKLHLPDVGDKTSSFHSYHSSLSTCCSKCCWWLFHQEVRLRSLCLLPSKTLNLFLNCFWLRSPDWSSTNKSRWRGWRGWMVLHVESSLPISVIKRCPKRRSMMNCSFQNQMATRFTRE